MALFFEDFNASFRVIIRDDDVVVEKLRGRITPPMVRILGVAMYIAAFYIGGYEIYALLLIEVVIWIVETVVHYILQQREIDLKQTALSILSINGSAV